MAAALIGVIALCIQAAPAAAATSITSNITEDTTWTKSGSPYYLEAATPNVSSGVTLTIESGVTVVFTAGYSSDIDVYGTIKALGTAAEEVIFTSLQGHEGSGEPGQYRGLNIWSENSTPSLFQYTKFLYGGWGSAAAHAALEVGKGVPATVEDSTFEHNERSGVRAWSGSHVTIARSTFANNGSGVAASGVGSLDLTRSLLVENTVNGVYIFSESESPASNLTYNTITGNGQRGIRLLKYCDDPLPSFPHGEYNNIYANGSSGETERQLYALYNCKALPVSWRNNYWGPEVYFHYNDPACSSNEPLGHLAYTWHERQYEWQVAEGPLRSNDTTYGSPYYFECVRDIFEIGPNEFLTSPVEGAPEPTADILLGGGLFGGGGPIFAPFLPSIHCGDPVNCVTGNLFETHIDLKVTGLNGGLSFSRTYNSQAGRDDAESPLGHGWSYTFGERLELDPSETSARITNADGSIVTFTEEDGAFTAPPWVQATLVRNEDGSFTYTLPDQRAFEFDSEGVLQSTADRNGNETTLTYSEGKLTTVTDPAERELSFAYDEDGRIDSVTSPAGRSVQFSHDEEGNLTSVTDAREETTSYGYDENHQMTSMTDARGGKTTNVFDAQGRVTSQTDPMGREMTWTYNSEDTEVTAATGSVTKVAFENNLPTEITRAYGTEEAATTKYEYDEDLYPIARTDPNGHKTSFGYDAAGNRTSREDALGNETTWTYDEDRQVVSMTAPGGEETTLERDSAGNPVSVSRPAPGEATQATAMEYDERGLMTGATDPLERTWSYEYDGDGNRVAETDPAGNTRSMEYDEDSWLTAVVSPRGNEEGAEAAQYTTTIERDAEGRPLVVTDPLGKTTERTYDAAGNLESLTDANGLTTKYIYNAAGERTAVEEHDGSVRETGYDEAGHVVTQTDGNGHTTTYVRDARGAPVEVIDPLERATVEEYDGAGNLVSKTDAAERTTTYTYDAADRLTKVSYSDEATPSAEFEYDKDGNLTGMSDGSGESTYSYDQLGRLTEAEDGHGDAVGYEYDLAEQLVKITYPNGKDVTREFDAAGRLEAVTDWLENTTSFSYDADSNLLGASFPEGTENVDEYAYDRAGRMTEGTFRKGAETLASLVYGRDDGGRLESRTSAGLPGPEELAYGYDEVGRLTEAGEASFEYDAADNLTKAPGATNTYDSADQLATSSGATFTYNALGERVAEASPNGEPPTYERKLASRLSSSAGLATDAEGNVWVADTGNDQVQQFSPEGKLIRQFGEEGSEDGQLSGPRAIAIGAEGEVYVADTGNYRIQQFTPEGEFVRKWGSPVENGYLFLLMDIAVDSEGDVWTLHRGGGAFGLVARVQEFNSEGEYITHFDPGEGSEEGQLDHPEGLAIDASDNLWIADTENDRVQSFDSEGQFLSAFGEAGAEAGQLSKPQGIAVDAEGDLWVADTGNDRLQKFSPEGEYLAQFGESGSANGQLSEPRTLTTDPEGDLWVADTGNNRVQEFDSEGEFLRKLASRLSSSAGLATDAEGNIWVADTGNDQVQQFSSEGKLIRQFGEEGSEDGQLSEPRAIAIGAEGEVYVADTGNYRIQQFTPEGQFVRKWGSPVESGYLISLMDIAVDSEGDVWTLQLGGGVFGLVARVQEFNSEGEYITHFDPGEGSEEGQLDHPEGLAIDASDNLWIADTENDRVQSFDSEGQFLSAFGEEGAQAGQLSKPQGIAVDAEGDLWVADTGNDRLQKFSSEGGYLAQFGESGSANGQLSEPRTLTTDPEGDLWVADTGNNRVQEWLLSRTSTAYAYDQAGNLTAVERPEAGEAPAIDESFSYDASGLLVSRTDGEATSHLTWDVSEELPLLLDDDENSYIYGPGGLPIEQISAEGAPSYLHHDQLGSTRMLSDENGKPTATFSYSPYGGLEASSGTATTPLGFAGQYTDEQSGLQYLRARFYDPATAQFISRDPIAALTWEPYGYAGQSPLQYVDPSGLCSLLGCVGSGVGGAIDGAVGAVSGAVAGIPDTISAAPGFAAANADLLVPAALTTACVVDPLLCGPAAIAGLQYSMVTNLVQGFLDACFDFAGQQAGDLLVTAGAAVVGRGLGRPAARAIGLDPNTSRVGRAVAEAPGLALEEAHAVLKRR